MHLVHRTSYKLDIRIDANGVALVKGTGQLHADALLEQRRKFAAQGLTGERIAGRPLVIDLREATPPDQDWTENFSRIASYLQDTGELPYRRAYVIAPTYQHDLPIKLLQTIQEAGGAPSFETRIFYDHADAYDWACDGWQPDDETVRKTTPT